MQRDRINVSVSTTRNLGNFNSIKLQADFETEVRAEDGSVENAFARAWLTVENEIEAKIQEALAE